MKKKLNEIIKEIGPSTNSKQQWTEAMVKGVAKEYAGAIIQEVCEHPEKYTSLMLEDKNRIEVWMDWTRLEQLIYKK